MGGNSLSPGTYDCHLKVVRLHANLGRYASLSVLTYGSLCLRSSLCLRIVFDAHLSLSTCIQSLIFLT